MRTKMKTKILIHSFDQNKRLLTPLSSSLKLIFSLHTVECVIIDVKLMSKSALNDLNRNQL